MGIMSRRTFLKSAAVGTCGVATMSILPGCAAQEIGSFTDVPSRRILILIGASPEGNTVKLADSLPRAPLRKVTKSLRFFLAAGISAVVWGVINAGMAKAACSRTT